MVVLEWFLSYGNRTHLHGGGLDWNPWRYEKGGSQEDPDKKDWFSSKGSESSPYSQEVHKVPVGERSRYQRTGFYYIRKTKGD